MNLLIFGPQGSGKGTQADMLAKKFDCVHIETGKIFRDIAKEDSELGKKVFDTINVKKVLISDELTAEVIKHYLEKVPAKKGAIIDSAPRTIGQIEPIEKMFAQLGRTIDKAIYIALPYEESVARITKRFYCEKCGKSFAFGEDIQSADIPCSICGGKIVQRKDDTPEGVTRRLKIFYETTVPAIEQYREKGLLIEIDGNQAIEKVFEDIIEKL